MQSAIESVVAFGNTAANTFEVGVEDEVDHPGGEAGGLEQDENNREQDQEGVREQVPESAEQCAGHFHGLAGVQGADHRVARDVRSRVRGARCGRASR